MNWKAGLKATAASTFALGSTATAVWAGQKFPGHQDDIVQTFLVMVACGISYEIICYLRRSVGVAINNRNEG